MRPLWSFPTTQKLRCRGRPATGYQLSKDNDMNNKETRIENQQGHAPLAGVSGCGFQIHELKTCPEYWEAVKQGEKLFEVRKNDRNYKVGDWLFLACYNLKTKEYEGRGMIKCEVTYLLPGGSFGVDKAFCVMGIKVLSHCR